MHLLWECRKILPINEEEHNVFYAVFGTDDVREVIAQTFDKPDVWLNTPQVFTGGKAPRELLTSIIRETYNPAWLPHERNQMPEGVFAILLASKPCRK